MNEQASLEPETTTAATPRWRWLLAGLGLVLLIWLIFVLSQPRPLKIWQDSAVFPEMTLNPQALVVDFEALNNNPTDFINQRIRVSGSYLRLEQVDCDLFSGPRLQWGLVAAGLQLNARGFEAIVLPLVPPNTHMTLVGIWRRYPGPAGCGKEPEQGLWYLEVEQIVEPNPLVTGSPTPNGITPLTPPPFPGTGTPTVATNGTQPSIPGPGTAVPNVTIVSTVVVSTPIGTPTPVTTAVPGLPTAATTPTNPAPGPATPTPGPGTPTAVPGLPTNTPGSTITGTPGGATAFPTPTTGSLITATPGDGYPGPTGSPPPTTYP